MDARFAIQPLNQILSDGQCHVLFMRAARTTGSWILPAMAGIDRHHDIPPRLRRRVGSKHSCLGRCPRHCSQLTR